MVTVRDVLELPEMQRGEPVVLTGDVGLDNHVRWVHVSELPDIAYLLRGGELILTTGIALPTAERDLGRYVDDLTAATASGLVIELGRKFDLLPSCLAEAARRRRIPLVALRREIRFVRVTEAVHGLIVGAQLDVLRASERIHRTFTELSTEGASPQEIVAHVARLAGGPVVLENVAHQVLAYDTADEPEEELLGDWERHSRFLRNRARTELVKPRDGRGTWVVTDVSARGEKWGRLLLRLEGEPTPIHIGALERGATALALNRLVDRDRETLERQSHRTLLGDIRSGAYSSVAAVNVQAQSLGVPLSDRALTGVIVYVAPHNGDSQLAYEARNRDYAELVAGAARTVGVRALVGVLQAGRLGVVLSLEAGEDVDGVLTVLAKGIHHAMLQMTPAPVTRIGVGSTVRSVRDLRRSLIEAEQVVAASEGMPDDKLYFALPDIQIRGLLYLLRDDPRLQVFVERELAPLLLHDEANGTDLTSVLRVYLACGGNKSTAAAELSMSRPALYQRLEQISGVLSVDLDGVEQRVSLHVALLGLDTIRNAMLGPDTPWAPGNRDGAGPTISHAGWRQPDRGVP